MGYTPNPFPADTTEPRRVVIEEMTALEPHLETLLSIGIRWQNYRIYNEIMPAIHGQLSETRAQLNEILRWYPETGRRPKWWTNTEKALQLIDQAISDAREIDDNRPSNRWLIVEFLTEEILAVSRKVLALVTEVDVEQEPERKRSESQEIVIKQFTEAMRQARKK